jgi:hypothetical protein
MTPRPRRPALPVAEVATARLDAQELWALASLVRGLSTGQIGRGSEDVEGLPHRPLALAALTETLAERAQGHVQSLRELERSLAAMAVGA